MVACSTRNFFRSDYAVCTRIVHEHSFAVFSSVSNCVCDTLSATSLRDAGLSCCLVTRALARLFMYSHIIEQLQLHVCESAHVFRRHLPTVCERICEHRKLIYTYTQMQQQHPAHNRSFEALAGLCVSVCVVSVRFCVSRICSCLSVRKQSISFCVFWNTE